MYLPAQHRHRSTPGKWAPASAAATPTRNTAAHNTVAALRHLITIPSLSRAEVGMRAGVVEEESMYSTSHIPRSLRPRL